MSTPGILIAKWFYTDVPLILLPWPVTQQAKFKIQLDFARCIIVEKKTRLPLKIVRFRGAETEFTASTCVSFPVCYVTNANYLISRGGTDIEIRSYKF